MFFRFFFYYCGGRGVEVVSLNFVLLDMACVLINNFSYAGIEARGFIFGPPIALAIGTKFVPLRKPKKLPGII